MPRYHSRFRELRDLVEVVAIVAAGIWAIYTFAYEQRIKPAMQPPSANTYTDVTTTVAGRTQFIVLTRHYENVGSVPIDVAGEALSVYGEVIGSKIGVPRYSRSPASQEIARDLARSSSRLLFTSYRLRAGAVGGEPYVHILLQPHGSFAERYVVAVPARVFQMIRVHSDVVVYKLPSLQKVRITVGRQPEGGFFLRTSSAGMNNSDEEYPLSV